MIIKLIGGAHNGVRVEFNKEKLASKFDIPIRDKNGNSEVGFHGYERYELKELYANGCGFYFYLFTGGLDHINIEVIKDACKELDCIRWIIKKESLAKRLEP